VGRIQSFCPRGRNQGGRTQGFCTVGRNQSFCSGGRNQVGRNQGGRTQGGTKPSAAEGDAYVIPLYSIYIPL